jgi:hypothetical protein
MVGPGATRRRDCRTSGRAALAQDRRVGSRRESIVLDIDTTEPTSLRALLGLARDSLMVLSQVRPRYATGESIDSVALVFAYRGASWTRHR